MAVVQGLESTITRGLESTLEAAGPGDLAPPDELERGSLVGRYVVLSKLGAGGMGVVFAAYDPELDRKVALKLLHPRLDADPITAANARGRLLREAQALARLNHPHIVAIHDVGEHAGAVWLAMEYVDGETLSEWLRQRRRGWREVLAVLTPAVRGLAAAHEAGLVHRDIKPDNIMIGRDQRVRVMDLGLSRAIGWDDEAADGAADASLMVPHRGATAVTRAGAVMGTPAYMSPEQFLGEPVDARADVFSLCATLWEALMGERPFAGETMAAIETNVLAGSMRPVPRDPLSRRVPGWLRRVCAQGLAVQPERRLASTAALLDALSRGRGRARARKWLAGAAVVAALVGSAFGYQRYDRTARVAACAEEGARVVEVWNDGARAGVRAGLVATGVSYAPVTAAKVMPFLDAQAEAWREQRARACVMAELEGTLDAEQLDRAVWCLDEQRMELAALVNELTDADARSVQRAVSAAAGLTPASTCIDGHVLAALPSPPPTDKRGRADAVREALSRARASLSAGRYAEALTSARSALASARELGWPPLTAEARQLEARSLARTGEYKEAEAADVAAFMEAAKAQAWAVAAAAALDLVYNLGRLQARHADAELWAGLAEVAVLFAGDPLGLREARRLNNLAGVYEAKGAYAEALALYRQALALGEEALGPDHPYVAPSLQGLAIAYANEGAYVEAKALHTRALAIDEAALGPDHPDVALERSSLAHVCYATGAYTEATTLYEQALAIQEKALGPDHPDVAATLSNLAVVHDVTGAYAQAKALHERALAIREKVLDPNHPAVADSLDNLAIVLEATGEHAKARALYERALAIREKALGPDHLGVAASLNNLASFHHDAGAYAEAKALHTRALAIRERVQGPDHPDVATSLSNLAEVHLVMGASAEARTLHERALAIRETSLGPGHPDVAASLYNLANLHTTAGAYAEAKALLERTLVIREESLGPDHPAVADSLAALGALALALDQPVEARRLLERAVAIYDGHEGAQEFESAARFSLATVLVLAEGGRARALVEARKAAEGFRALGEGKARELAEVEAFLAEHAAD